MNKYVELMVEDGCVCIDGLRFIPSVPVRNGRKYWFYVAYGRDGIYSVLGLKGSDDTGKFDYWYEDLREECSLGAVET